MESIRKQIIEQIKHHQSFLIMPSSPPDGDSLGSALALYLVLKKLNKSATVVCADPIPDAYQFLPTSRIISNEFLSPKDFIVTLDCKKAKIKTIKTKLEQEKVNIILTAKSGQFSSGDVSFHHGPSKYDVIITVDTGDLSQLGRFYEDNTSLFTQIPLINIDHHPSNNYFGRINLVDIMSSSTTELLIPLIQDLENEYDLKIMDEDIATLLLAGVITDTGSFQHANTTPKSFAAAAQLIRHGARQQEIIVHIFKTKQLSMLRLWGRILTKLKTDEKYHLVWSVISQADFRDTESREDQTGDIIDDLLTNAPGAEVVLLLKEKKDHIISGSLRTTNASIDASAIAQMFGGGGHVQAAGFKVKNSDLETVEKEVIQKIREYQAKRLNLSENNSELPPAKPLELKLPPVQELSQETGQEFVGAEDPEETLEENTPLKDEPINETSFIDTIIKKIPRNQEVSVDEENTGIELEPGVTYKFED